MRDGMEDHVHTPARGSRSPRIHVHVGRFGIPSQPTKLTRTNRRRAGKDKYENEDLIRYGWPEDVWFHVDKMSSAHVYVRMPKGETYEELPEDVVEDCCQLVKANSIQGCKVNPIDVVYTPWANLKKTKSMEVGQVSFHDDKRVKKIRVEKKMNEIVNRLNKTKQERFPDLKLERESYDREQREEKKKFMKEKQMQEEEEKLRFKKEKELKSYGNIMQEEHMVSAKELAEKYTSAQEYEDDFM